MSSLIKFLYSCIFSVVLISCSEAEQPEANEVTLDVVPSKILPFFESCQPNSIDWVGENVALDRRLLRFKIYNDEVGTILIRVGIVDFEVKKTNAGLVGFAKFETLNRQIVSGHLRPVSHQIINSSDLEFNVYGEPSWIAVDFRNYVLIKGWFRESLDYSTLSPAPASTEKPALLGEGNRYDAKGYMLLPKDQITVTFWFPEKYIYQSEAIVESVRSQVDLYIRECGFNE